MGVNLNDPRRADGRGWGPGWPHCDTGAWVPLEVESLRGGLVRFPNHTIKDGQYVENVGLPGGVRSEIHELVATLLHESEQRAYINLHPGWCWGGACRAIKTSSGGSTTTPSNHSWGLAVDLNAPVNSFGGSTHQIPDAMARLWNDYGFRWGGDYSSTKDWMHFEFMGTPSDAKSLTAKAGKELEDVALTKDQQDSVEYAGGYEHGIESGLGKGEPPHSGPRREGWRHAQRFLALEAKVGAAPSDG